MALFSPYAKIKMVIFFSTILSALVGAAIAIVLLVVIKPSKEWGYIVALVPFLISTFSGTIVGIRIQSNIRKKYGLNT